MTKPSGSFVAWDNTMCNPLAPVREQTKSAWEDGYSSAKVERESLAQPEQDPVAWMGAQDHTDLYYRKPPQADVIPLYTAPPQEQRCYCGNIYRLGVVHREASFCDEHPRKPLTDEEIDAIYTGVRAVHHEIDSYVFARAIEAAHGIKE